MLIKSFEDIIAWQKAGKLTLNIYKQFAFCKDYSFNDQIKRAAVSIMNNIAEGFERQTDKEFRNFLYIAKGSCGEVRSMLYLAYRLDYIKETNFLFLQKDVVEISRLISGLIKTL